VPASLGRTRTKGKTAFTVLSLGRSAGTGRNHGQPTYRSSPEGTGARNMLVSATANNEPHSGGADNATDGQQRPDKLRDVCDMSYSLDHDARSLKMSGLKTCGSMPVALDRAIT
jgi:hypothetical protein